MNSFYYGLALLAVILIVHWYIINDAKGQNDGTKGFLAMRLLRAKPKPSKSERPGKRSFRRQN